MIICSRKKAQELINSEDNLLRDDDRNKDIISSFLLEKQQIIDYEISKIPEKGRGKGTLNLSDERRKEIATLAISSGLTKEEVAAYTDISISQVGAYKAGATSSSTYDKREGSNLKEHVNEIKSQITGAAQNKLMMAIEELTGEKISEAKARDIAGIAKDMSAVIKNMNPDNNSVSNNVKVMIYQPRLKEESDFNVIEVNE